MAGKIALDSSTSIRYLNGDSGVVAQVTALPTVVLPLIVVVPMGRETAAFYSRTRFALKRKGRPIPENDIWIAAQCLEHSWKLATDDEHFAYVDGLDVERW